MAASSGSTMGLASAGRMVFSTLKSSGSSGTAGDPSGDGTGLDDGSGAGLALEPRAAFEDEFAAYVLPNALAIVKPWSLSTGNVSLCLAASSAEKDGRIVATFSAENLRDFVVVFALERAVPVLPVVRLWLRRLRSLWRSLKRLGLLP